MKYFCVVLYVKGKFSQFSPQAASTFLSVDDADDRDIDVNLRQLQLSVSKVFQLSIFPMSLYNKHVCFPNTCN